MFPPGPVERAECGGAVFLSVAGVQPAAETGTRPAFSENHASTDQPTAVTDVVSSASWQQARRPIAEYRVGDAVLSDSARSHHDTSLDTDVDPHSRKHLVPRCPKVDDPITDLELLRPDSWLSELIAPADVGVPAPVPGRRIHNRIHSGGRVRFACFPAAVPHPFLQMPASRRTRASARLSVG